MAVAFDDFMLGGVARGRELGWRGLGGRGLSSGLPQGAVVLTTAAPNRLATLAIAGHVAETGR
jgi:hypothetical protein